MISIDNVRRAVSLTAAVVFLVLGPSIADAGFVATSGPQTLTVGTATVVPPTAFSGTWACTAPNPNSPKDGDVTIGVTSVTGPSVPFRVTLSGGGLSSSQDQAAVPINVPLVIPAANATTTWTVTVRSVGPHLWTSSSLVKDFTCKGKGKDNGTF